MRNISDNTMEMQTDITTEMPEEEETEERKRLREFVNRKWFEDL